jgi:hypothetical protein
VHLSNIEINHKIHSLSTDLTFVKKLTENQGTFGNTFGENSSTYISAKKSVMDDTQLEKKI